MSFYDDPRVAVIGLEWGFFHDTIDEYDTEPDPYRRGLILGKAIDNLYACIEQAAVLRERYPDEAEAEIADMRGKIRRLTLEQDGEFRAGGCPR
jgi:hypothetical protein